MVDTIKFSQMNAGGDIENDDKTPGLKTGANVLFNNPWLFLASGPTSTRPAPSAEINYRLRFNTDILLYEYYDAATSMWVQVESSTTIQDAKYLTYGLAPSLPNAQDIGLLSSGLLLQDVISGDATVSVLPKSGMDGTVVRIGNQFEVVSGIFKSPTIQHLTSGSGTYTTPEGVTYIYVKMVGAGGGGSGSGTDSWGAALDGGATTFGSSLLSCLGGTKASPGNSHDGGMGGTGSISLPAYGLIKAGGSGVGAQEYITTGGFSDFVLSGGGGGSSGISGGAGNAYDGPGYPGAPGAGGGELAHHSY